MLQPPTPPPMTTTRACAGKSDATGGLLEPRAPLPIADPLSRPMEMLLGVAAEIKIESRDAALQQAPHRLARVGGDAHQAQPGQAPGRCLAEVGPQEQAVLRLVEIVVARKVRQIEEDVAHPGVLPVEDAQGAVFQEVGVEQIVVARAWRR